MTAIRLALVAVLAGAPAVAQQRAELPVPDLPGLKTLKADFHLHTVFSDGLVWPTVHVEEAWRDGLDVVALTDHVEYQPHTADVSRDLRRPDAVARAVADELGMVLIAGAEITRPVPNTASPWPVGSAHFNALFVSDPAALAVPDLLDALRAARAQGAFVFWNHPGFMRRLTPQWYAHVDEAWRAGLFAGMELVNGEDFYAEAYPWIAEKGLTILANSDYHRPTPPSRASGTARPITLVFARAADAEGVREALTARRTAAWLGEDLWGAEEHLRGVWQGAVSAVPAALMARAGRSAVVRLVNRSAIPFRLRVRGPVWLSADALVAGAQATTVLRLAVARDAPSGVAAVQVTIENLHVGPGRALSAELPVSVTVVPQ
jgi:3',5'-nucleoside bisphosphate phosphatase